MILLLSLSLPSVCVCGGGGGGGGRVFSTVICCCMMTGLILNHRGQEFLSVGAAGDIEGRFRLTTRTQSHA